MGASESLGDLLNIFCEMKFSRRAWCLTSPRDVCVPKSKEPPNVATHYRYSGTIDTIESHRYFLNIDTCVCVCEAPPLKEVSPKERCHTKWQSIDTWALSIQKYRYLSQYRYTPTLQHITHKEVVSSKEGCRPQCPSMWTRSLIVEYQYNASIDMPEEKYRYSQSIDTLGVSILFAVSVN